MSEETFPSFRYGPDGQSAIFENEDAVPSGWHDHPSKVKGARDPSKDIGPPRRPDKATIMKDLKRRGIPFNPMTPASALLAMLADEPKAEVAPVAKKKAAVAHKPKAPKPDSPLKQLRAEHKKLTGKLPSPRLNGSARSSERHSPVHRRQRSGAGALRPQPWRGLRPVGLSDVMGAMPNTRLVLNFSAARSVSSIPSPMRGSGSRSRTAPGNLATQPHAGAATAATSRAQPACHALDQRRLPPVALPRRHGELGQDHVACFDRHDAAANRVRRLFRRQLAMQLSPSVQRGAAAGNPRRCQRQKSQIQARYRKPRRPNEPILGLLHPKSRLFGMQTALNRGAS
jgi:hypothetical protein